MKEKKLGEKTQCWKAWLVLLRPSRQRLSKQTQRTLAIKKKSTLIFSQWFFALKINTCRHRETTPGKQEINEEVKNGV